MKLNNLNDKRFLKDTLSEAGGVAKMIQGISVVPRARSVAKMSIVLGGLMGAALSAWSSVAQAEVDKRYFVSAMFSRAIADDDRLTKDGNGGIVAAGWQVHPNVSFELYAMGAKYGSKSGAGTADFIGGGGAISYFPFARAEDYGLSGLYALLGTGYGDGNAKVHTVPASDQNRYLFDVGVGYLQPVLGDVKLRVDLRYRYDRLVDPFGQFNGENSTTTSGYEEPVVSVGFLVPLGARPAPPVPVPVAVVEPVKLCADGADNDGDGKIDFPADAGCTSAEDSDETDPPQCSDGKDNDGDGLTDQPADAGCVGLEDNDEADPCKSPSSGERLSMKGCKEGDVIILRGVNFEFDDSRLTVNAKTILDGVADELNAYPDIRVEIGGYTDARGSDEYNQKLSEGRAEAVVGYLEQRGIAKDRMVAAGHGEGSPVSDNETDEGRELNRRVELKIVSGSTESGAAVQTSSGAPQP